MAVLLLRLLPDLRCHSCGRIGFIHEKTQLCLICLNEVLEIQCRNDLQSRLRRRFRQIAVEIQAKLREFGAS